MSPKPSPNWLSRQPRWHKKLILSAIAAAIFGIALYLANYYTYQNCPVPSGIGLDFGLPDGDCLNGRLAELIAVSGLGLSLLLVAVFGYMVLSGHDFNERMGRDYD